MTRPNPPTRRGRALLEPSRVGKGRGDRTLRAPRYPSVTLRRRRWRRTSPRRRVIDKVVHLSFVSSKGRASRDQTKKRNSGTNFIEGQQHCNSTERAVGRSTTRTRTEDRPLYQRLLKGMKPRSMKYMDINDNPAKDRRDRSAKHEDQLAHPERLGRQSGSPVPIPLAPPAPPAPVALPLCPPRTPLCVDHPPRTPRPHQIGRARQLCLASWLETGARRSGLSDLHSAKTTYLTAPGPTAPDGTPGNPRRPRKQLAGGWRLRSGVAGGPRTRIRRISRICAAPEALKRALECARAANSDPQLSHVRHCRAYSPALRPGPALRARQYSTPGGAVARV